MKKCPDCSIPCGDAIVKCDCGYFFKRAKTYLTPEVDPAAGLPFGMPTRKAPARASPPAQPQASKRYPWLRRLRTWFQLAAVLPVILGLIKFIELADAASRSGDGGKNATAVVAPGLIGTAVGTAFGTVLGVILCLGFAQAVRLLMDIGDDVRAMRS